MKTLLVWVLVAAAIVFMLAIWAPAAISSGGGWQQSTASAYSRHSSGTTNGCDGSTLRDRDLTIATFLIPCGARARICVLLAPSVVERCVNVTRKDSGPYPVGRRGFDLNLGVVQALGFRDELTWGVRHIRWRRIP